ncbi:Uncharacterised protein [Mycobacteroides abscessus subsp. abscessus]|nr:Uncharacterised protein [Mycobacteroides abscessus subsp. abscessus]
MDKSGFLIGFLTPEHMVKMNRRGFSSPHLAFFPQQVEKCKGIGASGHAYKHLFAFKPHTMMPKESFGFCIKHNKFFLT